ncbi:hypothetical protein [Mucilaginibacter sp. OK098]|uniref:hypothetical protein n=1 Tax=Mucilaginibacter sp. OK098 TaxID=1855297 RepID=UPI00091585A6|nr:hypothetical protein [Mucilaginibacter sp. OK098]SHN26175.1 hypothetical protein SAMN05216524_107386 [Mucilaginibacter sp. OK098]
MATLTTPQVTQLTLDYKNLGDQLMQYLNTNVGNLTSLQYIDISNRISTIYHNTTLLGALTTYQTVQDLSVQIASINQASANIDAALKSIADVQKIINIATTIVNLGVSILTFNVNDIITNAGDLIAAVS